eukprot:jgi/Chlat1/4039/Chrsp26S04091
MEVPKLPPRATRGKRMHAVMQEDQDADDEFWNQDALLEDEQDDEYEEEEVPEDVVDSDFDESESEEDDETPDEDTERRKPRRTLAPPGSKKPSAQAKNNKTTNKNKKAEVEGQAAAAAAPGEEAGTPPKRPRRVRFVDEQAGKGDGEGEGEGEEEGEEEEGGGDKVQPHKQEAPQPQLQRRASRRTAVLEKAAEREQKQKEAPKTPVKKIKPVAPERRLTQEEMLQEAAQTEVQNLASLEYLLAVEEEIKKKATVKKAQYTGPLIRYHSKGGCTTLEFQDYEPKIFALKGLPYVKKAVCAVTGLPAKYRDPKTGAPYATLEAFKILRERLRVRDEARRMEQQSAIARKRTRLDAVGGGRRSPSPGPLQLPSSSPLAAGRVTPPPPPLSHMKPVVIAAGRGVDANNTPLGKASPLPMQPMQAAAGGKVVTPSPLRVVQTGAMLAASPLAHATHSPAAPELFADQASVLHQSTMLQSNMPVAGTEPGRSSQAASRGVVGEDDGPTAVLNASVSTREQQEAAQRSMDFDELFHSDLGLVDAADVLQDSRPL